MDSFQLPRPESTVLYHFKIPHADPGDSFEDISNGCKTASHRNCTNRSPLKTRNIDHIVVRSLSDLRKLPSSTNNCSSLVSVASMSCLHCLRKPGNLFSSLAPSPSISRRLMITSSDIAGEHERRSVSACRRWNSKNMKPLARLVEKIF